jgi:KDO2-lipid IV(A) lauroyltransferase
MNYFLYLIFICIGNLIALLPFRLLYILSDILYYIVYYVIKYRKKIVFENLHNSFPDKTQAEINIIAKKFYRHFCDILLEIVKLLNISPDEIVRRMKLKTPELFFDAYDKKLHILMIIGHYGNWEWGQAVGLQIPYKFIAIYKPLSNKYFDELMIKLRSQFQGMVVPMKMATRVFLNNINNNIPTELNFIADQTPHIGEINFWTQFLNQRTPVFHGVEKLAIKTKQPVFFSKIVKVKRGYYEVYAEKLCDDASTLKPHEITELHVKALERTIIEAPEYWLWTHRRWKYNK